MEGDNNLTDSYVEPEELFFQREETEDDEAASGRISVFSQRSNVSSASAESSASRKRRKVDLQCSHDKDCHFRKESIEKAVKAKKVIPF